MISIITPTYKKLLFNRAFLAFALILVSLVGPAYGAQEEFVPLRLVTVITQDDQGQPVNFPHALAFDRVRKETYLVSSLGRVTVYDHKFFPIDSFGKGRGLVAPEGIAVDRKGNVYVCQGYDSVAAPDKLPRLSIFNPAFFLSREIVFSEIPELKTFSPRRVAVSNDGVIYLVGSTNVDNKLDISGCVVLSPEGKFLRWIKPLGPVYRPDIKVPEDPDKKNVDEAGEEISDSAEDIFEEEIPADLLPAPSARDQEEEKEEIPLFPVNLSDVVIDDSGRLYLLSRETSKIYVYNGKEEFLFKFGEKGGSDGKLSNPVSLAVDIPRKSLYIVDYMRHTILGYDYDKGRYIFEFGGRGLSPLWFNFPNDIDVDSEGQVIVADLFNRRVQVIDPNMLARRPLAGTASAEMGVGELPTSGELLAQTEQEPEPEIQIAEPPALTMPAPVASVVVPPVVAAPKFPVGLSGVALVPRTSLPSTRKVPERAKPSLPKDIGPVKNKKAVEPVPVVVAETVAGVEPEIEVPADKAESGKKQRVLKLRSSLGVYGPVAALGLIGGWLLYRNK